MCLLSIDKLYKPQVKLRLNSYLTYICHPYRFLVCLSLTSFTIKVNNKCRIEENNEFI